MFFCSVQLNQRRVQLPPYNFLKEKDGERSYLLPKDAKITMQLQKCKLNNINAEK